jgi:hypothetical protein
MNDSFNYKIARLIVACVQVCVEVSHHNQYILYLAGRKRWRHWTTWTQTCSLAGETQNLCWGGKYCVSKKILTMDGFCRLEIPPTKHLYNVSKKTSQNSVFVYIMLLSFQCRDTQDCVPNYRYKLDIVASIVATVARYCVFLYLSVLECLVLYTFE